MSVFHEVILTRSKSSRERYKLVKDGRGMGGYGMPPDHYSRHWLVVNGVDRGNGYQGYMSVDYALSEDCLPESAKALIRETLGI